MNHYRIACAVAASTLALGMAMTAQGQDASNQGQQPRAAGGFGQPEGLPPVRTVHITGENPGLQLRLKAGGPIVADFNYWKVAYSPVGSGHVCYVTTRDSDGNVKLRIAITDNKALEKYVTNDTMSKLVPNFGSPPYKVIEGTFKSEGDAVHSKTESCISKDYKVAATWSDLTPGRFGGMQPGNGFFMNFIISMAGKGEITINGKRLDGEVLPGQGRPPAYLAFAETWLTK